MAFKLENAPVIAITLLVAGVLLVSFFLAMGGIRTTLVTGAAGCNATNTTGCGAAYDAVGNFTASGTNVVTYMPTIGTLTGVALLIGVVFVGFLYLRNKNSGV